MRRVQKQYRLNWHDALRGLIIAVLSPVFTVAIESLNKGDLILNWKAMIVTAISAALGYILKNFLEPTKVVTKS